MTPQRICVCGWRFYTDIPVGCPRCGLGKSDRQKKIEKQKSVIAKLVVLVSRFRKPYETGIGDTIERLLANVGGRKIKHIAKLMSMPCGCDNRQKWLNSKYPYVSKPLAQSQNTQENITPSSDF